MNCAQLDLVHRGLQIPLQYLFHPLPFPANQLFCFIGIALFDLNVYLFSYPTSRAYVVILNYIIMQHLKK